MDKKTIMFDAFKTQKTYKQILTEVYKALEEKDTTQQKLIAAVKAAVGR